MKVSGFTIARNIIKYNYPALESIRSLLPLVDEFIVNVGDSDDGTLELIQSLRDDKVRIIENKWDSAQGKEVLSYQTNLALKECRGDWAFYLQGDEVVHEADWGRIRKAMEQKLGDKNVDALRFRWLHFYGSFRRYRIEAGWYQKQDRIIRNNGEIQSIGDAYAFGRKDGKPLKTHQTGAFIYHYGWVQPGDLMQMRRVNASEIGFVGTDQVKDQQAYDYGDLNRFPVYYGTHPQVMDEIVEQHDLTQQDWQSIRHKQFWNPCVWLRPRFKTGRRVKEKIL